MSAAPTGSQAGGVGHRRKGWQANADDTPPAASRNVTPSVPPSRCAGSAEMDPDAAAYARARAARIIARIVEIFGQARWRAQHGEVDPIESWTIGTADLSQGEIKRGLRECMASGETWPPSLPVFRSWCRPGGRFQSRDVAATGFALPHKLSDEERARGRRGVAEARAALSRRSVDSTP